MDVDFSKLNRSALEKLGFQLYETKVGIAFMLLPLNLFSKLSYGTVLHSILYTTIILDETHDLDKIDGKKNPNFVSKDYRTSGEYKILAYGFLVEDDINPRTIT